MVQMPSDIVALGDGRFLPELNPTPQERDILSSYRRPACLLPGLFSTT
jgi:hypothetical protein